MNLERTSHWITIIGNAGLLIGVALVIFQINQNSELVREQLDQAVWTDDMNLQLAIMGENPAVAIATAIENPSTLSVEDSRVLDAYILYWSLANTRKIYMHERGMTVYPPASFLPDDARTALATHVLGNAFAKARFEDEGLGPRLTTQLQPLVSSLTGDESWEQHQRLIARIKENQ